MLDFYEVLGLPRQPWLDPEALKETYHRRSATLHPDVPGSGDAARFADLNAAFAALKEPASRLRHLSELCGANPARPAGVPPAELGDLFMALAGARRQLDQFRAKQAAASSTLARALLAGDEGSLRQKFVALSCDLESAEAAVLQELRQLDAAWERGDATSREALPSLADRLAYLTRWLTQTREALFSLGA